MSLYRAGLKLAFFLPLGVATPSLARRLRFHRCEPRSGRQWFVRRDGCFLGHPSSLYPCG